MKSGLYAWAGASATASAAAWAKRLDEPITNRSNVYLGLRPIFGGASAISARRTGTTEPSTGSTGASPGRSSASATASATRSSRPVASRTPAFIRPRKCPSIHSRVKSFGTETVKVSSETSRPWTSANQVW